MNTSVIFGNVTYSQSITSTSSTAIASETIRTVKKYYASSPFDSWYIGGLLFMITVILVLLYANFYQENSLQILWARILRRLQCLQPVPQTIPSSHPTNDSLLP